MFDLVNCILESEIWVKVELSCIARLQLQHELVYV